jgi:hypothetical protein
MASGNLDERKLEHEVAAKQRELDLNEREVAAKEREVATKEKELERSRWLNPTVIGILVAAVGLITSVVVARLNNKATQEIERQRAQSTIILEAIRTGTGNTDASCKNLVFLSNLGLIDDPQQTIHKQCASVPAGIPSLPSLSSESGDNNAEKHKMAESIRSLRNNRSSIKFHANLKGDCPEQVIDRYSCHDGDSMELMVTNNEPFNLFVAAVGVGPTGSVDLITQDPMLVPPSQTIRIVKLGFTAPYGTDTLKVVAAKEPFDANLFFLSRESDTRGQHSLPRNGDWGVVDLLVDTSARPSGASAAHQ